MKRTMKLLTPAVCAVIASCTGATGGAPPTSDHERHSRPATVRAVARRCPAAALVLRPGEQVVPMTGEHAVTFALTNRGPASCSLAGYPDIVLYDARGAALPFRYADGGGPYVTTGKPMTVVLAPHASAYVLVAKYRCDLGITRNAADIRLSLPAGHGPAFAGRAATGVQGPAGLSYCRGGPHDPGQAVVVSPVEPTRLAAGRQR